MPSVSLDSPHFTYIVGQAPSNPAASEMGLNGQDKGIKSHGIYFYALVAIDEMGIFYDNIGVSAQ